MNKLFSIVLLTYNQENLILETLNSILNQDYDNIELIISDDNSSDGTIKLIEEWVSINKNKFINIIVNKNKKNEGISGNHAKGIKLANGEFVKYLGGDDILLPNAVTKMVSFFEDNPNANFCVSKVDLFFLNNTGEKVIFESLPSNNTIRALEKKGSIEQFKRVAISNNLPAPGTFFRKKIFEKCGYPNPNFKTFEDWHLWLNFLIKGEKLYFMKERAVLYRRHKNSLSASAIKNEKINHFLDLLKVYDDIIFKHFELFNILEKLSINIRYKRYRFLIKRGINRKNNFLSKIFFIFDPFFYKNLPFIIIKKMRYITYNKIIFDEKESEERTD